MNSQCPRRNPPWSRPEPGRMGLAESDLVRLRRIFGLELPLGPRVSRRPSPASRPGPVPSLAVQRYKRSKFTPSRVAPLPGHPFLTGSLENRSPSRRPVLPSGPGGTPKDSWDWDPHGVLTRKSGLGPLGRPYSGDWGVVTRVDELLGSILGPGTRGLTDDLDPAPGVLTPSHRGMGTVPGPLWWWDWSGGTDEVSFCAGLYNAKGVGSRALAGGVDRSVWEHSVDLTRDVPGRDLYRVWRRGSFRGSPSSCRWEGHPSGSRMTSRVLTLTLQYLCETPVALGEVVSSGRTAGRVVVRLSRSASGRTTRI